jgi:hypothetical protein
MVAFIVLSFILAGNAIAADTRAPCKTSPKVVGACFVVHGRMFFANGNPSTRLWRIGTNRILGIVDGTGPGGDEDAVPPELLKQLGPQPDQTLTYADFTVCPFTRERKGWMRLVCIESTRNVIVRQIDK